MNTNDFIKFIKGSYSNRVTTKDIKELYLKEQNNENINFKTVDRKIIKIFSPTALNKIKDCCE